ncbi:adhesion G-protein coupled receptor G4 [Scomber scombrus]|uniref:Adhesion G-protein coupled receptor G4 n=1 Tax=Scomber scombrus TaxID=13677 RepID=A0AAV1P053_SCOSC
MLSLCLLKSTSTSTSLWGKKLHFQGRPCTWQLLPGAVVPALKELSVCVLFRRSHATTWTAFVYKAPKGRNIELGLGGTSLDLSVWLFGEVFPIKTQLKLKEWYSVCLTWSGQAQTLRVYINGSIQLEAAVNPILPKQLAQNGTLTLGISHYVDGNGEVKREGGKDLLGEIGLFRMWSREWSTEEMGRHSCADGDVLRWDLQQWKYDCSPEPDISLHCAWSIYKIKMWTSIVHSTKPGNCSMSLEKITRNWLESIFPPNISVRNIYVSSQSHTCHVVNHSAAEHVQRPESLWFHPSFSCEVHVDVDPAASVEVVQVNIAALLSSTFSYDFLNVSADPNSISILPLDSFSLQTKPPPIVSTGLPSSEMSPTQSLPAQPANVSTTEKPLDLNDTAVGADKFFRVNLTLNMTGSSAKPAEVIEKWVKEKLEVNGTMVLNLIITENVGKYMEQYNGPMLFRGQQKLYDSSFHVQEYKINSIEEIKNYINASLMTKYENGSIIIETLNVGIKHLALQNCFEETTSTIYGQYIWPETFPQVNEEMLCIKPELRSDRAYRLCKLDIETDTTSWADPDMTNCHPLVTISDLGNITVTTGNAAEVVHMIDELVDDQLGDTDKLSSSELDIVVEKLNQVVDISIIKPALGANIVSIVADILLSKTDVTPVANIVLNLTDRMGHNMKFQGESASLTAPSLALSMINVDQSEFSGLTFGVFSISSNLIPKIFVNQSFISGPLPETNATISLPSTLNEFFPKGNKTRVQFQFYGTDDLFQDPLTTNATHSSLTLISSIVSASINDSFVNNLKDPVVVTLRHQKLKQPDDKVQCMFWDFQNNGGQGGWNSRGCETLNISSCQTSCRCNHLTHFAVLLDVSRAPISEVDSQILTLISYLGCGISSIFLGITLLTYLAFEKLRQDYPSKILINLSFALLGMSMLFLLDSWLSSFSNYGLCIATAATLHYFLLASFTWMGLEAVHMYLALVKVFNIYVPSYILKFCAMGWGIPLVIVSLVLAIDKDAYGSIVSEAASVALKSPDPFCWLQNDIFFYVTVVAFVVLILLCNLSVFIVVLIQIRKMQANKPSVNSRSYLNDLRAVASLTVLLGLTWTLAFFSFGPAKVVLMYLFSIFNTLQGFFIFLFHCLMKENVRKQWRIHLCCGCFKLSDYSDWSHSGTVGGRCKKNNLVNSDSVASDNTYTNRKVSDSSTGSRPNHH